MKKKWKMILGSLVLLIAAGFLTTQAIGGMGTEVEVIEIEPRDIKHSFSEEGVVTSSEERNVLSIHTAKIDELFVEEGERVEKDDLLAVLDDRELTYSIEELRAEIRALEGEKKQLTEEPKDSEIDNIELQIERAKEGLETADRNYERIKTIYEEGFVTEQELEKIEDRVTEAEYNLKQREKALEVLQDSYDPPRGSQDVIEARQSAIRSRLNLLTEQKQDFHIHAPISGVVTNVTAEEGGMAGPELPMMTILNKDECHIEVKILTQDIYELNEGDGVTLIQERRGEDKELTGEITRISPYAEESVSALGLEEERVKVTVSPDLPEDLHLAPGYKLNVEFTAEGHQDEFVVPKTSLFSYEGEEALFVIEDGTAEIRQITTGFETRRDIVIREGISYGDKVILDPSQDGLEEGASVAYIKNN